MSEGGSGFIKNCTSTGRLPGNIYKVPWYIIKITHTEYTLVQVAQIDNREKRCTCQDTATKVNFLRSLTRVTKSYLFFWEIDKIGYTRVVSEQNRVPFFSRRGALTHVCKTPPKRVLAPEPTTPCVRAAPQTVFSVFDPSKQRQ